MKAAQILREKINSKTPTIGVIITFHYWLGLIEIARSAGLDYVILDLEHQNHGATRVAEGCALGRLLDFPVLVRPPQSTFEHVHLAMDLGGCGLLLPMVNDTETLDKVRDAIYMPPRGQRRPGGPGNRWVGDYNYTTFKSIVEDDVVIIPQIESPTGLSNVDAIARHELTTALGIGPYDLSARLGVCWQPDHPKMRDAVDRMRRAADGAGKAMWCIGDGPTLRKEGFHFICCAEPVALLEARLKSLTTEIRQQQQLSSPQSGGEAVTTPM